MSRIYDNWERLVGATLNREELRELARVPSLSSVFLQIAVFFQFRFNFLVKYNNSSAPSGSNSESLPSPRSENETLKLPIPKPISFKELKNATRNFGHDTILAEGACGPVFKGWINEHNLTGARPRSGMTFAVKMCNFNEFQDSNEMLTETNYLSQLHHPSLLKLIGYCREGDAILLVNEFMPKGSLDNHLFRRGQQCLSWTTIIKVAVGAARGLSFFHDAEKLVICRVFQSFNILLDQDFNVKLSGFTLARFQPSDNDTNVSNRVARRYGYAAPEYMVKGHLTKMCDVYSFGVVLLELPSGRPIDVRDNGKTRMLSLLKQIYLLDNRRLNKIMDTKLDGQYPQKVALTVATLALQCLSDGPKDGPEYGRGWINEHTLAAAKLGSGMAIAVKKSNPLSVFGFNEWLVGSLMLLW
ncbi:kinase 2B, chloroplastic-like [Olea europaea subsp. europaea]|uniref:Kinase 2B, chloroplastic-like n=1 Tax=Olea europaea subsp. europaea TaxID=158383 RepID=A0A8S0R878_OLEEU|nr:kinase 2B, chloroplastic-like [Olea europaea subsp. europaea]